MREAYKWAYVNCYSCPKSTILVSDNGDRMVECGLNGKVTKIEKGMSYPTWCGLYGVNHKRKGAEQ